MEKVLKSLNKNYWWQGKAATREKSGRGRAGGGQLIGIKKKLKMEWSVTEWEFGLQIVIKKDNKINYIIITGYNNKASNIKKFLKVLDEKLDDLEGTEAKIIVAGDLNARIGEEQGVANCGMDEVNEWPLRKSEDKEIRQEGKKLIDWCERRTMMIMNGRAEGDEEGKITCVGHGMGLGSVLDLVLIKMEEENIPEWFKGLKISPQEGSDHLMVFYRLDWGDPRREENTENLRKRTKYKLRWKAARREEYKEVSDKIWEKIKEETVAAMEGIEDSISIETKWQKIKQIINETAEKVNMTSKGNYARTFEDGWDNGQYRTMRKKLFKKLHVFRKKRDWSSKMEYLTCRKETAKLRKELIKKWIDDKQKQVQESKNLSEWWRAMSWFRKKRKCIENNISGREWQAHFENLLNEQPEGIEEMEREGKREEPREDGMAEESEALNKPLEFEEVQKAMGKLKAGKAAGEDGITTEFLTNLSDNGKEELYNLIKEIWEKGEIVQDWRMAIIFPIYKSGDENQVGNYRGISLLDIGYKILATIMASRLGAWLEEQNKLTEAQGGFRSKRGAAEHIFVLNTLIGNRLRRKGGKLYTCFVDFKKAFDRVNRKKLWKKMEDMGIKGKFLEVTKEIYRTTWNGILIDGEVTGKFETNNGVRQGCPLSPILFNIFINDLEETLTEKKEGGTAVGSGSNHGVKIFVLIYADDVVLLAEDGQELERMLKTLERWSDENQLEVNTDKTKILVFSNGGRRSKKEWKYKEVQLEIVQKFKYLGFWFTTKNSYKAHINKAIGKTQLLINKVWGETMRAGITDLRRKLYFMDSTVKAGAMYGVELWGWSRREELERLQGKYTKMSMGLAKNTPDYIWKLEAGRRSIEIEAFKRSINFMIKIYKMEENRWVRKCLMEEIRAIKNNNPSKWGKDLERCLKSLGDGQIINQLWDRKPVEEVEARVRQLIKVKLEQDVQTDWSKVDKSSFCEYYKSIKEGINMEVYWGRKDMSKSQKEGWARWRCGNAIKEEKKGFSDRSCRGCRSEKEVLEHVVQCDTVLQELKADSKTWWQDWRGKSAKELWRSRLIEGLKGNCDKNLCKNLNELETILRKRVLM
ncbi:uncharacterized protein LOC122508520 [Leptopilina heterotoma]|uniref:uncharacterized protein LOC122508520 n=1 Tax=Leptopilina heterotoma TaxID=63436 RepID=UPI001CA81CA6|nr:uncharacterized protein LOC122508520 [Leptopilina heterotoma]